MKVVLHPEQCENLVRHVHEELGHFGVNKHTICSKHSTSGKGCNYKFNNLFLGVWCVIEFGHLLMHLHLTSNLTIYGAWVLTEFGFCQPIEFEN